MTTIEIAVKKLRNELVFEGKMTSGKMVDVITSLLVLAEKYLSTERGKFRKQVVIAVLQLLIDEISDDKLRAELSDFNRSVSPKLIDSMCLLSASAFKKKRFSICCS